MSSISSTSSFSSFSTISVTTSDDSDDIYDKYIIENKPHNFMKTQLEYIKTLLTQLNNNSNNQIIGFKISKSHIYIATNCAKIIDYNNICYKDIYGIYTDNYIFGLIPFVSSKTTFDNNYVIVTQSSKLYKLRLTHAMTYMFKYAAEVTKQRINEVGLDYIKEKEFDTYNIF